MGGRSGFRMFGPRGLVLTLAAAAVVAAAVPSLRRWSDRWAAGRIRARLPGAGPEEAERLLARAAGLGEAGLGVVIDAMGSSRQGVAEAAWRALDEELRRWEPLAAKESSPKLAALARLLARRVAHFDRPGREKAKELATRILLWPLDRTSPDRLRVIAHCEEILLAARRPQRPGEGSSPAVRVARARGLPGEDGDVPSGGSLRHPPPSGPLAPEPVRNWVAAEVTSRPEPGDDPLRATLRSEGPAEPAGPGAAGGSPRRAENVPREADAQVAERAGSGLDGQKPMPEHGLQVGGLPGAGGRRPAAMPAVVEPPYAGAAHVGTKPPDRGPAAVQAEEAAAAGSGVPAGPEDWGRLSTVEVMHRLESPDGAAVRAARSELTRRGLSEVELELAGRLVDPDPAVRRALARLLPQLRSLDAEPWLRQLAQDADASVRREAMDALARTRGAGQRPREPGGTRPSGP